MKHQLDQEISVVNALTGNPYLLLPISKLEASPANLDDITAICNQELVYKWCFRSLCDGKPYPPTMASDWINWGTEGWEKGTHFVYVVTSSDGRVAAACDIKSADLKRAEIGYWSSADHRGIMTNAVRKLIQLADNAGFRVLFADIHPENRRSLAVIKRCGFHQVDRRPTIEGHIPFDRIHSNRKGGENEKPSLRSNPNVG
ncbi:MAG: GNAT family N-acetyltransferase [Verrucomicrobiales bacterium]|nr:GNAT family N-acetyltransferase [Verrucomicrobiales bacterium]